MKTQKLAGESCQPVKRFFFPPWPKTGPLDPGYLLSQGQRRKNSGFALSLRTWSQLKSQASDLSVTGPLQAKMDLAAIMFTVFLKRFTYGFLL